jgi:hypothetical protein
LQFTSSSWILAFLAQGAHEANVQAKLRHRQTFLAGLILDVFVATCSYSTEQCVWENSNPGEFLYNFHRHFLAVLFFSPSLAAVTATKRQYNVLIQQ